MGSGIEDLRAKLAGLSRALAGGGVAVAASPTRAPAAVHRPPSPPRRRADFQPTVRSGSVLGPAASNIRDAPLGGLLQKMKDAEAAWLKEKGKLALAAKAEQQRRAKAEAELRRVQEQLAFRLGEVKHLKAALRERDGQLAESADRLRAYELAEGGERTAAEEVRQAQAERDELRGAIGELLSRLEAANGLLSQADSRVGGAEAAAAAVVAERQRAEEEAAAARAEAQALRDAVADLEFKCDLLKSLSDLTLRQNDERTATLRALLDSESALEGGEGGDGAAAGGSDSQSDEGL